MEVNIGEEFLNKVNTLIDHALGFNEKYENCIEEIFKKLRKGNEKLKKITNTLAPTHKFISVSSSILINLNAYLRIEFRINRLNHYLLW